ncbi:hypothetical protein Ahy_B07g087231 [Arachis hypogaea]|uniref:BED-type domain-containing protein n=1 Tax=Arachis hypogaea TaxID=3818 RepID=A0A444YBW7_ARAHY|nr:hypothetical protein Ahy_B07g087231 [Arachis hypogaea]
MPWLAIPFSNSETISSLKKLFQVRGIPSLVLLDEAGKLVTKSRVMLMNEHGAEAYPFTSQRIHELKDQEQEARRNQTLTSILVSRSRDFVISSDGKKVLVSELEGKIVGLYFYSVVYNASADFTPKLLEVYKKLREKGEKFEVVGIPLDSDEESFKKGLESVNEVADRDVPMLESAEHSASTLPPLPTTSSERKNRSTVWDHFKRTSDDENKAQCQHCMKVIKCGNGTSAMRSHLKICISNPTLKHQKAFELLEMQDKKFVEELNKGRGVPLIQDWDYAKSVLPFLEMFYDATFRISGSFYVTNNLYMKEVFALGRRIQQYRDDDDLSISLMEILDPCHKLDYVEWFLVNSFGAEVGGELKTKLSSCLHSLYNLYLGAKEGNQDDTLSQPSASDKAKDIYDMGLYHRSTGRKSNLKSELDHYLNEDCEPDDKPLDILGWWKVNSNRFSILANMARDILAIPVSTVASESAFSMGGRIIDQYRSSLTPKMVEALVCTEDWLKGYFFSSHAPENFEDLEKVEQDKLNIKYLILSEDITCSVGPGSIALEDD